MKLVTKVTLLKLTITICLVVPGVVAIALVGSVIASVANSSLLLVEFGSAATSGYYVSFILDLVK